MKGLTKNQQLKIWWAKSWRVSIGIFAFLVVVPIILNKIVVFIEAFILVDELVIKFIQLLIVPTSFVLYAVVFWIILNKDYKEFRFNIVDENSKLNGEQEISWKTSTMIGWSVAWREFLYSFILGLILSFLLRAGIIEISQIWNSLLLQCFIPTVVAYFVVGVVFGKNLSKYSLRIVETPVQIV